MARRARDTYRILDIIYDDLPEGKKGNPEDLKIALSTGEKLTKRECGNFSSESKIVITEGIIYSNEDPEETLEYLIANNIIEIEEITDEV